MQTDSMVLTIIKYVFFERSLKCIIEVYLYEYLSRENLKWSRLCQVCAYKLQIQEKRVFLKTIVWTMRPSSG